MSTSTTRRLAHQSEAASAPAPHPSGLTQAQHAALHHVYQLILSFAPPPSAANASNTALLAPPAPATTGGDA